MTAGSPTTEICNNIDDDCDGMVDEGITRSCYTGPTGTSGVGACAPGTETCSAGTYGSCERCGEPIEPQRLLAQPLALRCLDCQARAEREQGGHTHRL